MINTLTPSASSDPQEQQLLDYLASARSLTGRPLYDPVHALRLARDRGCLRASVALFCEVRCLSSLSFVFSCGRAGRICSLCSPVGEQILSPSGVISTEVMNIQLVVVGSWCLLSLLPSMRAHCPPPPLPLSRWRQVGLYEDAVALALTFDGELAASIARQPSGDEALSRKLWLSIARHMIEQGGAEGGPPEVRSWQPAASSRQRYCMTWFGDLRCLPCTADQHALTGGLYRHQHSFLFRALHTSTAFGPVPHHLPHLPTPPSSPFFCSRSASRP